MKYAPNSELESIKKQALSRYMGDEDSDRELDFKLNQDYSSLYSVDGCNLLYVSPFGPDGFNYKFLFGT